MLRMVLAFAFGYFCSRPLRHSAPPGSRTRQRALRMRSFSATAPRTSNFLDEVRLDDSQTVSGTWDAVSVARAHALRIAQLSADAAAALNLAVTKVHAGIIANPRNAALLEESQRLRETADALAQAFLTLYAKQLTEMALDVIASATDALKARAAEMPAATKTVGEIQPLVSAGVAIGTAIGKA